MLRTSAKSCRQVHLCCRKFPVFAYSPLIYSSCCGSGPNTLSIPALVTSQIRPAFLASASVKRGFPPYIPYTIAELSVDSFAIFQLLQRLSWLLPIDSQESPSFVSLYILSITYFSNVLRHIFWNDEPHSSLASAIWSATKAASQPACRDSRKRICPRKWDMFDSRSAWSQGIDVW